MVSSLLITKLYIPKPRADWIARPQLILCLQNGLSNGNRLTLVCAPAGYGKTALVASWLAMLAADGSGCSAAWLALDESDNDPVRFFSYMLSAFQRVYPEMGESISSSLSLPQLPSPVNLMVMLINELMAAQAAAAASATAVAPVPLVLVLEDYHFIQNSLLQEAVELLVNQAPAHLHLVLITREDPPFPLARLRGQGEITEIRAANLRFRPEESASFFASALQLILPQNILLTLNERCEGWAVGLRMAALALREYEDPGAFIQAFRGSHHYVTDFLMEEVLHHQSPEVKRFLHQTAVLDRFNASLCCALFGPDDNKSQDECQRILMYLERSNLFMVPLDATHTWFRYHHLFADLLRSRLDPSEKLDLYIRASSWFEQHGLLPESIQYAVSALDAARYESEKAAPAGYPSALNLVARLVRQAAEEAIQRVDLGQLMGWLQHLPDEYFHNDLELAVYRTLLLFLNGKMQLAQEMLTGLENNAALKNQPKLLGRVMVLRAWMDGTLTGQIHPEIARTMYGQLDEDDLLFKVLACQPLGGAQIRVGNLSGASAIFLEGIRTGQRLSNQTVGVTNVFNAAFSMNAEGRRSAALRLCRETLPHFLDRHARPLPAAGLILVPMGVLQYEANEVDVAIETMNQGLHLCRQISPALVLILGPLVMAYLAKGEAEQALEQINTARRVAEEMQTPRTLQLIDVFETQLRLGIGQVEAAAQCFQRSSLQLYGPLKPVREMEYLTGVRLLLAQGQAHLALDLIDRLEQASDGTLSAEAGGRLRFLMSARVLRALIYQQMGNHPSATKALAQAVRLAAPENYLRLFLNEGTSLLVLLPDVRAQSPNFVDQLMAAFQANQTSPTEKGQAGSGVSAESGLLSEREMDVLRLMAEGYANQEIADQLVLALSTVKRHNSNIFTKLGVGNRTQALIQANKLGLL